jgi:hypothetical protein
LGARKELFKPIVELRKCQRRAAKIKEVKLCKPQR